MLVFRLTLRLCNRSLGSPFKGTTGVLVLNEFVDDIQNLNLKHNAFTNCEVDWPRTQEKYYPCYFAVLVSD